MWSSLLVWLQSLGLNPSQSSSAAPFPTPPAISYTCQHSLFFQLYWAARVSLGRCGPMARSQSSPSSQAGAVTKGSCFPVTSWVEVTPSPWLKAWPQLFNISMKPVKGYRYVKWPCQGLAAQLLLCKTALNGPAPCVPSPSSGLWGWGHPIYICLIFPGHLEFWAPLQTPIWGPRLGCTLFQHHLLHSYSSAVHGIDAERSVGLALTNHHKLLAGVLHC